MPLFILGLAIVVGLAALIWRQYRKGAGWHQEASFFVDLLAMAATALIVGVLALAQLSAEQPPAPGGEGPIVAAASPEGTPTEARATRMRPSSTETEEAREGDEQAADETPEATRTVRRTPRATREGTATEEATPTPTTDATTTPEATATATTEPTATPGQTQVYRVQAGDQLNAIAARFGVTAAQILAVNPGLEADSLRIDQEIIIPTGNPPTNPPPAPPTASVRTYTVQEGDYLNTIAARFGVTAAQIIALNPGIDPENLQIGQVLRIP